MKKIKIVNIIHSLVFGGTESFLYNYLKKMNMQKFDIYILSMKDNSRSDAIKRFEEIGIHVILVDNWEKKPIQTFLEIKRIFKKENFDIIHSHLTHTNFYFMLIGKLFNIKMRISHSHLASYNKDIKTKIKHILYKFIIKKTATVYCACGNDSAIELYGSLENVLILKNAIDISKYEFDEMIRMEYRKKFNIGDNDILYANIGRMSLQKNQIFLIDIFKFIKKQQSNAKLLIVGDGVLKEKIYKKIYDENLIDSIIILSDRSDINNIYQMIDSIIFPSIYEGLGIVLIEAQVSGIQCFASKDVIPKEVQITDKLQFVSLDDSAQNWANEIINVDIKRIKRKNYSEVILKNGYEIKNEAKKLENLYLSVIS